MRPGHGRAVFAVLQSGVHHQVTLVELGVQLHEAGFVDLESGIALVVRAFHHQVAIGHIKHARGVAHRARQHAVARAAGAPGAGYPDVGAVGVIGHAPAACGHGANAQAAEIFVANRHIFFVPEVLHVHLAIAPALAQQARQLNAFAQVVFETQVRLYLGEGAGLRVELSPLNQLVGPDALLVLGGEELAVLALVAASAHGHFGKPGQAEHAIGAEVQGLA